LLSRDPPEREAPASQRIINNAAPAHHHPLRRPASALRLRNQLLDLHILDAGFTWKLGDFTNGFIAEGETMTLPEAIAQLREAALKHFPDSDFAKAHRNFR
jgi:hypothetical protein